jgi:hypothetical protein
MTNVRRVLFVIIAALALAACKVDTRVDVVVQPDGTGNITLTAVADAELVQKTPGLAEDLRFDDVTAAGWTVDGPTPTADGGLTVSVAHPFATVEEATALRAIDGASYVVDDAGSDADDDAGREGHPANWCV